MPIDLFFPPIFHGYYLTILLLALIAVVNEPEGVRAQEGRSGLSGFGAGDVTNACRREELAASQGMTSDEHEDERNLPTLFYAPPVDGPIPPHVIRRMMRLCTRNPYGHPDCAKHPEWISPVPLPPEKRIGNRFQQMKTVPVGSRVHLPSISNAPDAEQRRHHQKSIPRELLALVPPNLGWLNPAAKATIASVCASAPAHRSCLLQKPESLHMRAVLAEQQVAIERTLNPWKPLDVIDREVERRFKKMFTLKAALNELQGLDRIVTPANDGTFGGDGMLTESQTDSALQSLGKLRRRLRRRNQRQKRAGNALFFEGFPVQKWPLDRPVPFTIDTESFNETEKAIVRAALGEIQQKSCVRFEEHPVNPVGQHHIYYVKVPNPTFCGRSNVGRVEPFNQVLLTFTCPRMRGVAVHETLHALGLHHEHQRIDRDEFVEVHYENIDPQNLDYFAVQDINKFTSYGIKYDYLSIMHYATDFASEKCGAKTLWAKKPNIERNELVMGQRFGMAPSDVEALNKMYCEEERWDEHVLCGYLATHGHCFRHQWMAENCRKSCERYRPGRAYEQSGGQPYRNPIDSPWYKRWERILRAEATRKRGGVKNSRYFNQKYNSFSKTNIFPSPSFASFPSRYVLRPL